MELRLILVLIGAVIVAAVWLFSRPRKPAEGEAPRAAPSFDDEFPEDDLPSKTVPGASAKTAPVKEQGAQLILALHVMPRAAEHFTGTGLKSAFEACLLRYGRYNVFHRLEGTSDDAPSVFSVANVVEPGSFELGDFTESLFPGLTLFMVLPGPRGGVAAYADMLATARRLAQLLGGEVLDQERSTLTRQTARHIRERIIQFELQRRLTHPS